MVLVPWTPPSPLAAAGQRAVKSASSCVGPLTASIAARPVVTGSKGGSRYWIVTRDFKGELLHPVGIYARFGDCKALVKRGSDLGASVCIGVPSRAT